MKTLSITAVLVFCVSLISVASKAEARKAEAVCPLWSDCRQVQQQINRTWESASSLSVTLAAKHKEETELVRTEDTDQKSDILDSAQQQISAADQLAEEVFSEMDELIDESEALVDESSAEIDELIDDVEALLEGSDIDEESVDACCEAIDAYESIDCSRFAKLVKKTAYVGCVLSKASAKNKVIKQCGYDPTNNSNTVNETLIICRM